MPKVRKSPVRLMRDGGRCQPFLAPCRGVPVLSSRCWLIAACFVLVGVSGCVTAGPAAPGGPPLGCASGCGQPAVTLRRVPAGAERPAGPFRAAGPAAREGGACSPPRPTHALARTEKRARLKHLSPCAGKESKSDSVSSGERKRNMSSPKPSQDLSWGALWGLQLVVWCSLRSGIGSLTTLHARVRAPLLLRGCARLSTGCRVGFRG